MQITQTELVVIFLSCAETTSCCVEKNKNLFFSAPSRWEKKETKTITLGLYLGRIQRLWLLCRTPSCSLHLHSAEGNRRTRLCPRRCC